MIFIILGKITIIIIADVVELVDMNVFVIIIIDIIIIVIVIIITVIVVIITNTERVFLVCWNYSVSRY